jgi:hypothetical protein
MKKLTMSLVLLALAFSLFAQDTVLTSKRGIPILPVKGDISIGIDAVPFFNLFKENTQSPGFSSPGNIPMIAMRYFLADNRALRMEVMVNYRTRNFEEGNRNVTSSYGINMGHEWRFGSTRVQGFAGVQGGVFYAKEKTTDDNDDVLDEYSTVGVGAEGFLGAEVFIAPKLSIGGQFAWGPTYSVSNDIVNEQKVTVFSIDADNLSGALILAFYF